ncbi:MULTISPECIES: hypothetical protein [Mycobacteriaceae]|uniref:hypothetical protein n=1 Tax=Mycobacteriaceae TaxID=1762 RepID=UPI000C260BD7|nr:MULTISPECIES: hypothetical protein [Mycobacteriaceae]
MSSITYRREYHLQANDGAFIGLRGNGFRAEMIRRVVRVAHHHGEPFDPRFAGLALQEASTLGRFVFQRVAVVGKPLLRSPVLIGNTLNVGLTDTRPERPDRHFSAHTWWPLNITRAT